MTKDYLQWWRDRVRVLQGFENDATKIYGSTKRAYDVGPWVVLKLALLAYHIRIYSEIIKRNFPKAYYVDYFAGSGLNKIEGLGVIVLGSALLADRIPGPKKKFDKLLLVERNKANSQALQLALPNATVMNEDENGLDLAQSLGLSNPGEVPILGFVDPEGLELHWSTLEQLLRCWSDVIITYQTTGVRRALRSPDTITKFFGTPEWQDYPTDEGRLQLYVNRVLQYKDIVEPIRVQGTGGFHYYMIFATRKTRGPQGWLKAILDVKAKIEAANSDDIENLLEIFTEKQATLDGMG